MLMQPGLECFVIVVTILKLPLQWCTEYWTCNREVTSSTLSSSRLLAYTVCRLSNGVSSTCTADAAIPMVVVATAHVSQVPLLRL